MSRTQGPSQADQLVALAESRYTLAVSPAGEPVAVPLLGPQIARMLRGGGTSLRAELAAAYSDSHGKAPSAQALADALLVLEGRAQGGERRELHLRVAQVGASVVLDLGDTSGRAVRVDPGRGWTVLPGSPVLFRRSKLTGALPEPVKGGDLAELWDLLNVAPADRPLILAWLIAALLPGIPHPVLGFLGEQGTGKSTNGKIVASVLDPAPAQLRTAPRDVEGWAVAASGSWVVGLDNVSTIPAWLSDALCRAVTGDGMVRRALYTDDGLSVLAFRRALLLTAIATDALRGDLADRLLAVECQRIPARRRRLDQQLAEDWTQAHPRVLGALLTLAAQVLAALPEVRLDQLPRMADFARILAAVDRVLGTDGCSRYLGQGKALAAEVVDADPVAAAVRQHVTQQGEWTGTAAELLAQVTPERTPKDWPATARGMTAALTRAAPALRSLGITVDQRREAGTGRRLWCLAATPESEDQEPSQPPQPAQTPADLGKRCDGSCDGCDRCPPTVTPTVTGRQADDLRKHPAGDGCDGEDGSRRFLSADDHRAPARDLGPSARCGTTCRRYGQHANPLCPTCRKAA